MKQEKNKKTKGNWKETDEMVRKMGGIFLMTRTTGNGTVYRDPKSPVFIFNINNPAGLSTLLECEKELADQSITQFIKGVFWLGKSVDTSGKVYLGSTNGSSSAPATQDELIERVNRTIDTCMEYMKESIDKYKQIHAKASNRMAYYIGATDFGIFIKNRYPQLCYKKDDKSQPLPPTDDNLNPVV